MESNTKVLEDIRSVNKKKNARNIQTFDFSTLYTKIPQEDLKEKLKNTVEKAFKGGQNQYIMVKKRGSHWHQKKNTESLSKDEIFQMIDTVIDNSYFRFGNKTFRQCIGIPMGIDPAPQMANLYLYAYEANFMEKLTKENYSQARKFNRTRRFIDDLHTINNDGELEKHNKEGKIYPKEMKLNLENMDNNTATFLDLDERIKDNVIIVKTFDKREAFNFEIVNYPDLSGNIPKKQAYGIFSSQLIRYARICSQPQDLIDRVKLLTTKLLKKKYTIEGLKNAAKKCLIKHTWIRERLGRTSHKRLLKQAT